MALVANKANRAMASEMLKQINAKENRFIKRVENMIERIKYQPITVGAKVGTTDKIFGSVTNVQLADAIAAQTGVQIDRRKITIIEEVKVLGTYRAEIRFREDLKYDIDFEVIAE
jgi:large subunit ribosomal protein L9